MKKLERQMLTALAVSWLAAGSGALGQTDLTQEATPEGNRTAQAMESNPVTTVLVGNHSLLTTGPAEKGLTLNLRGAPVDGVLKYLSEAAGFTIIREADTEVPGTVDMASATPLNKEEIVLLLNKVLAQRGLAALQDGRTLTIMSVQDAERFNLTPVVVWNHNPAAIPQDARIVTEVIGLHSLSPTQVVKDLSSLLPPEAGLAANEGGNAIILTARQADIRRFTQIIQALDSSGESDLEVFQLELCRFKGHCPGAKGCFRGAGCQCQPGQSVPESWFNRGGGAGSADNSKRAAIRVNAVSDDQNNAILVSAPADIMSGISNLIHKLDIQQDDVLQIRHLYASITRMRQMLPTRWRRFSRIQPPRPASKIADGGMARSLWPAQWPPPPGPDSATAEKNRLTVIAVPDPRTQSVIITASKDNMAQIEKIIAELDSNAAGTMQVYVYQAKNGDVADMQGPLSDLFGSGSQSSTSSLQNALALRANQAAQSSTTTALTTSVSTGGSSGGK